MVKLKLSSADDPEDPNPMKGTLHFTMNTGEKYLVFEKRGEICAEEKKHFYNWRTISDQRVNPHRKMKKFDACDFCCYEKR